MKIEVITTGDELLSGAIPDTNFTWMAERLWGRGFQLVGHLTVADDRHQIREALLGAANDADVVIVTGGLGPTTDDITLEAAAEAFGVPLVLDSIALKEMEGYFKKIGRVMSPNNKRQALLPRGGVRISNKVGSAPGCHIQYKNSEYFFMPGVPAEMKGQFAEFVLPLLKKKAGPSFFSQKIFRCFGMSESDLDQALRESDLGPVRLSWRFLFPEILIKISTTDPKKGIDQIAHAEKMIRGKVGQSIYAEGDETIEKTIGRLLNERKETLSVAESCTGGLISNLLTNVPGSSEYFERGVVVYSNDSKMQILGIDPVLLRKFGAVSPEVATAMAEGIREKGRTTYGIAVTGIAGPSGGTEARPVGTVHIAVAGPQETKEKKYFWPRDRESFKLFAAHVALHKLRRMIA
ncbi:MAG: competence/damage-inducible protein A [Deltaproteobacteria bacterium]|nr:competence/damage-inducible protein A [Deltaproteobacteria bacterium]MBI4374571.1 competence/damage-inducible protein A [Deltaproteobacteria bacterium]